MALQGAPYIYDVSRLRVKNVWKYTRTYPFAFVILTGRACTAAFQICTISFFNVRLTTRLCVATKGVVK
jgi:homogentisate 1,2-dioxygenase